MLSPISEHITLKIAIYRTSSIGDVVLATACLDLLKKCEHIKTKVIWFGREPTMSLLQSAHPDISFYSAQDIESGSYDEQLKRDLAGLTFILDLQKSLRSRMACRKLGKQFNAPLYTWKKRSAARSKHVFLSRWRGRSRPAPSAISASDTPQYQAMCMALLKGVKQHVPESFRPGLTSYVGHPNLIRSLQQENSSAWAKELQSGQWLAVAPGASYDTKRAPEELFVQILSKVSNKLSTTANRFSGLVFLGDQNDRQAAVNIIDQLAWQGPILNLAGKIALLEAPSALGASQVLISNDSSLGHIAEAVGTPVACLFGPTAEIFGFAPWRKESRSFSVALGCRPCSKHGKDPCRFQDKLCFYSLPTEDIATFLTARLSLNDTDART